MKTVEDLIEASLLSCACAVVVVVVVVMVMVVVIIVSNSLFFNRNNQVLSKFYRNNQ